MVVCLIFSCPVLPPPVMPQPYSPPLSKPYRILSTNEIQRHVQDNQRLTGGLLPWEEILGTVILFVLVLGTKVTTVLNDQIVCKYQKIIH